MKYITGCLLYMDDAVLMHLLNTEAIKFIF